MQEALNPDQWKNVLELFEQASKLSLPERASFLESADASQEVLCEVSSLLARAESIRFDTSLGENSRESIGSLRSLGGSPVQGAISRAGTQFARFLLTEKLGHGGMAEVYSAFDTTLQRTVALKFLLTPIRRGTISAENLLREARIASALNHPNIVTIYEIIESESTLAIAMEFVTGESLRALCAKAAPLDQVARIGAQIAAALAAAHKAGIVHRDIKPENVIVREDGSVKVLDFGLAQYVSGIRQGDESDSPRTSVVGTFRYMSPEQVNDGPVGGATDIFSLGIVLYEMSTGKHPFPAPSALETLQAIVLQQPAKPSSVNAGVSESFDQLILDMLAKESDVRPPAEEVGERLKSIGSETGVSEPRPQRELLTEKSFLTVAGALVLVFAGAFGIYRQAVPHKPHDSTSSARTVPFSSLQGSETHPSFSPDSQSIAFVWNGPRGDNDDIYVKRLEAPSPTRLTTDPAGDSDPAWSPDGSQIAFLRSSAGLKKVVILSLNDKAEHIVGEVIQIGIRRSTLTWSPDGREVVVSDSHDGDRYGLRLIAISVETGKKRQITSPPREASDFDPAFSSDGRTLAFLRGYFADRTNVHVLGPGDRQPRQLTSGDDVVTNLAWAPDGGRLVYSLASGALWSISSEGGPPRLLMQASEGLDSLTIAKDGDRMAYVNHVDDQNIWLFGNSRPASARLAGTNTSARPVKLISSSLVDDSPRFSPDNSRIAFSSNRSGNFEIWTSARDGSDLRQITAFRGSLVGSPTWSPDGKEIAFDGRVNGNADIYVVGSSGGPAKRLTYGPESDVIPSWSANGEWIYFSSERSGTGQIWTMPAAGGPAKQMTQQGGFEAAESFDGRFLYYTKHSNFTGLYRLPTAGGAEERILEPQSIGDYRYWELARGGIYFVKPLPYPVLNYLNLSTRRVTRIRGLPKPPIESLRGLSVSSDGSEVLYTQSDLVRHQIMLVENAGLGGK